MNKETLQSYNNELGQNNTDLDAILETINNLPEAVNGMLPGENEALVTVNMEYKTDYYQLYYRQGVTFADFSNVDTSKVTNMGYLFAMTRLKKVNLKNLNTSNVTNMFYMFQSCSGLTELDLSDFDTGKVEYFMHMFSGCTNLASLNLGNWNTGKVINTQYMFYNCSSLTELDLSSFDTSKVTRTLGMFRDCTSLKRLDIRNSVFTSVVNAEDYDEMFLNVPNDCLIIVKDDTVKTWITTRFTSLTNVKTVAEL